MNFQKRITKTMSCVLAIIMLIGVFTAAPASVASAAVQNGTVLGVETTGLAVGSEVRIKNGVTTDYYGKTINVLHTYLSYTVTKISGDKISITAQYVFGSVSQTVNLDMKLSDIVILADITSTDSDLYDTDTERTPTITVGSTVTLNSDAKDVETGKDITAVLRLLQWNVDSINGTVAKVSCKVSLGMLEDLGISKESIASALGWDVNNFFFQMAWQLIIGTGYTFSYSVELSQLTLVGGSSASTYRTGIYTTNSSITMTGEYWDERTNKTVQERVAIPANKSIFVTVSNDSNSANIYLNGTKGKYYTFTNIDLKLCAFVSKEQKLFNESGLTVGCRVQLAQSYNNTTSTNFGTMMSWLFTESKLTSGYDRTDVKGQLAYNLVYTVTALRGDSVVLSLTDEWQYDKANHYIGDGALELVIAPEYVIPAAGTYRITSNTNVYTLSENAKTEDSVKTTIGSLSRNAVLYIGDSDMESTYITNGAVAVKCNNLIGYVDLTALEFVSSDRVFYGEYRDSDTLYIKTNVTSQYNGEKDLFTNTTAATYFGSDYKTEAYKIPYTVEFAANDYVVLVETKQSRISNGRQYVPDNNLYRITLSINDVSKYANISDVVKYGDVDQDGYVKMTDITLIQRYIASLTTLSTTQKNAADVNGDKNVKLSDVVLIQQFVASLITRFPVDTTSSRI